MIFLLVNGIFGPPQECRRGGAEMSELRMLGLSEAEAGVGPVSLTVLKFCGQSTGLRVDGG